MENKWSRIVPKIKAEIKADGFEQRWILDPQGYFLIRINRFEECLEVGHCSTSNQLVHVIKGRTPESIMYKIIDQGYLSLLDHAAYLGKELQKAYLVLKYGPKYGFVYEQDAELRQERPAEEEKSG